jgi:hypothetical protein
MPPGPDRGQRLASRALREARSNSPRFRDWRIKLSPRRRQPLAFRSGRLASTIVRLSIRHTRDRPPFPDAPIFILMPTHFEPAVVEAKFDRVNGRPIVAIHPRLRHVRQLQNRYLIAEAITNRLAKSRIASATAPRLRSCGFIPVLPFVNHEPIIRRRNAAIAAVVTRSRLIEVLMILAMFRTDSRRAVPRRNEGWPAANAAYED